MFLFQAGILQNASNITDVVRQSIEGLLTSILERLPYLIAGAVLLLLFWFASTIIRKIFWSATAKTRLDERLRILFSRLIVVFVLVIGVFTALTVVIPSFAFGDFVGGLGLTSLAIGFATKDILSHLFAGVLILWQQPFRIGDYVILKDDEGKVEYIGVRATSLRRGSGELVLIPNGDIYSSPFRVRKAGLDYPMSFKFALGFSDDLQRAKEIACETITQCPYTVDSPEPTVHITELSSEGVRLSANFRINSTQNSPSVALDNVASNVIRELTNAGFTIYPPTEMLVRERTPDGELLSENGHRAGLREDRVQ
jgi:small conductance mechanosensitive channel